MTKTYDNVILGNVDLYVQTAEGGSHKAKYNMMVTSDDPIDLQVHTLEASDEVYTSESGKTVRIVVRPAQNAPKHAVDDTKLEALKARVAELEANKPVSSGSNGSEPVSGDVPF